MFLSLIQKRRSIRQFKEKVPDKDAIDTLIEAALRSPSSRSLNPWEFIVVTDKEKLAQLSEAKPHGATFLKNAPLGIVVCTDPEKCDVWIEDASIASTFIQLAAEDLGLGSCWIQIRGRVHKDGQLAQKKVREILSMPDHLEVLNIIAVGYPDEDKKGHAKDTLLYDKVHYEQY